MAMLHTLDIGLWLGKLGEAQRTRISWAASGVMSLADVAILTGIRFI